MSTLLYATTTEQRQEAPENTSQTTNTPKTKTYVDAVAALVPAEVLAAHAIAVSQWTTTKQVKDASGKTHTETLITDPSWLQRAFWVLVAVAALLYIIKKLGSWTKTDYVRVLIPPLAFVVWTAIQQNTAFDAVFHNVDEKGRTWVAVIVAILLGALAKKLGDVADSAPSPTPNPNPGPNPDPNPAPGPAA